MKLLSKNPVTQKVITGKKSDGSDRQVTTVTTYNLSVLTDDGVVTPLTFDHDPGDSEVYAAATAATVLTPLTKADWAKSMKVDYDIWRRWKDTRVEAQARGSPAGMIPALLAQENAAWTAYAADLLVWNQAS